VWSFFEEVGQAATKVVSAVGVPTVEELETGRKCGEELGQAQNPIYMEGEYLPYAGHCDPAEYLPGGGVETAE
jgi:hypothetical protein